MPRTLGSLSYSKSSSDSGSGRKKKTTPKKKTIPKKKSPKCKQIIVDTEMLRDPNWIADRSKRICNQMVIPRVFSTPGGEQAARDRLAQAPRACQTCEQFVRSGVQSLRPQILKGRPYYTYHTPSGTLNPDSLPIRAIVGFNNDNMKTLKSLYNSESMGCIKDARIARDLINFEKSRLGVSEYASPALKVLPYSSLRSLAVVHNIPAVGTMSDIQEALSKLDAKKLNFSAMYERMNFKQLKAQAKQFNIKLSLSRKEITKEIMAKLRKEEQSYGTRLVGGPYWVVRSMLGAKDPSR